LPKADKHGIGQDGRHRFVELARLGAVALVHIHIEVALGLEIGRQGLPNLLDLAGDVTHPDPGSCPMMPLLIFSVALD